MAFVPKCTADIFVSYAHADDEGTTPWSARLITALEREIRKRLGTEIGSELIVWRDTKGIRLGDNWVSALDDVIRGAATFLALVSPNYMTSRVCSQERETFLRAFDERDPDTALRLLAQSRRFLKLIRLPLEADEHLRFLSNVQHVDLYESDPQAVAGELQPDSEAFRRRILECATAIKDILIGLRRGRERVFVAWPAEDCGEKWKSVQAELKRQGYDVQPPGRVDHFVSDDLLQDRMKGARVSLHLIGAQYSSTAQRQIQVSAHLKLRQVFWLCAGADQTADERQRQLISHIRDGKANQDLDLPAGYTLLEALSLETLCENVLAALRQPSPQPFAGEGPDQPSVYICCDQTTATDYSFAERLRVEIAETAKATVLLPPDDPAARRPHHKECLRRCDGVLVYSEAAPREWLAQVLEDVAYADKAFQRRPLRAKALLTPDVTPWLSYPIIPIIRRPRFTIGDLQEFLNPLREDPALGIRA